MIPTRKKTSLTCVIPAHNEAESILEFILEIDSEIGPLVDLTIYVSEDGSSDNTREKVLEAKDLATNSKVILSPPASRLGYSKAVQNGIGFASTELILFMDSDGQCDPGDFAKLLESYVPGSMVVGYRNPRADGINRILFSKAFGFVYRMFGFPKLIDPSSPYLLVDTNSIREFSTLPWHLNYGFWWEFQARVATKNINVVQIPVSHRVRAAGVTQVYTVGKLPRIVSTHLKGLYTLRKELDSST